MSWEYGLGDYLVLKKKHPCGSFRWQVLRLGADIRIKCHGCGRLVTLPRQVLARRIKAVEKNSTPLDTPGGYMV